jgi:hypothetical protein
MQWYAYYAYHKQRGNYKCDIKTSRGRQYAGALYGAGNYLDRVLAGGIASIQNFECR